jgi:hypothetical protein
MGDYCQEMICPVMECLSGANEGQCVEDMGSCMSGNKTADVLVALITNRTLISVPRLILG